MMAQTKVGTRGPEDSKQSEYTTINDNKPLCECWFVNCCMCWVNRVMVIELTAFDNCDLKNHCFHEHVFVTLLHAAYEIGC